MKGRPAYTDSAAEKSIHSYYNKILSLMPFLIYWIDESCNLQGFNANFGKLLNIFSPEDCKFDPYKKLAKSLNLSPEDAESLKIEDMQVIFSGIAKHDQAIISSKKTQDIPKCYSFNRDPILNEQGKIIGALIIIMEKDQSQIALEPTKKNDKNTVLINKPKVLIVEDNETAQKVEANLFINLNCDVDAVTSGAEAMSLFKPGKYNLVIMDIGLADSSGYLLSRKFREMEDGTNYHTAIIALTSYKPENVKSDCLFYKMEGVVAKPITESQANQIINHFVYNKDDFIEGLF